MYKYRGSHLPLIISRTSEEEDRTRIHIIIIDISSQLPRIAIHHTRRPDCIQVIHIKIRRCRAVVHEDFALARRACTSSRATY